DTPASVAHGQQIGRGTDDRSRIALLLRPFGRFTRLPFGLRRPAFGFADRLLAALGSLFDLLGGRRRLLAELLLPDTKLLLLRERLLRRTARRIHPNAIALAQP